MIRFMGLCSSSLFSGGLCYRIAFALTCVQILYGVIQSQLSLVSLILYMFCILHQLKNNHAARATTLKLAYPHATEGNNKRCAARILEVLFLSSLHTF